MTLLWLAHHRDITPLRIKRYFDCAFTYIWQRYYTCQDTECRSIWQMWKWMKQQSSRFIGKLQFSVIKALKIDVADTTHESQRWFHSQCCRRDTKGLQFLDSKSSCLVPVSMSKKLLKMTWTTANPGGLFHVQELSTVLKA